MFQHTAARRRLVDEAGADKELLRVSTHSRPKAAGDLLQANREALEVSTHSRPKAAGILGATTANASPRFNTQPPEGGWRIQI